MADDSVRIEYNQCLKPLEELLEGVERAGDFFASGAVEIPMPKVEVEGVGTLSFPVPGEQIQQLIQQATRAPYGRGEETILDESVRKVWQLPPEKVRLGGKSWAASFDGILKQVTAGLGCEGMAVTAELYKLLVYDTGGFFLAHRDTEKAGGMFGTLVVVLPSEHRGGELVIRHADRETTVDMSSAEVSEVSFAAFYADCEHEIRPITAGNRVCLVFNLIQERGVKMTERGGVADQPQQTGKSDASPRSKALRLVEDDTAALRSSKWPGALMQIAEAIVGKLGEVGKKQRDNEWLDGRLAERAKPVSAAGLAKLLNTLGEMDAPALRVAAAKEFAARPAVFDPVTILTPALGLLHAWDEAAGRLWEHSAEFLLKRSGQPPESPRDWRQDVQLSCACADCRELQAFTLDPVARQHRFRVKKERRQHLHQQIEHHGLDMTHETDRSGSPQTLVGTKDRRSYQRRCKEYCQDIAALEKLTALAGGSKSESEGTIERIAAARALAKEWSPA